MASSLPEYASPPCFAHLFEEAGAEDLAQEDSAAVSRWRKGERERLLAERLSLSVEARERAAQAFMAALDELFRELDEIDAIDPETVVSAYWPIKGEIDLRAWLGAAIQAKRFRVAMPVVVAKGAPLTFRAWSPGARMERGVWNIPVPADGEPVIPQIVIAPLVGHDAECYRLGYGGGFFDRTLGAMEVKPLAVGVGLPSSRIRTIRPQPHDVPMDFIVTGSGGFLRRGGNSGGVERSSE